MNKVILLLFLQIWLWPNVYSQNNTNPVNADIFIDSSFLNIKLNVSELHDLKKQFINIDPKKIQHTYTPWGGVHNLSLLLNKNIKINLLLIELIIVK